MIGPLGIVLASSLLLGSDNDDAIQKEQARLAGTWRFALVEVDGAKQPEVPFATHKIILVKDGTYLVVQGLRVTRGTLKPDPTHTPGHYDLTITDGPAKGQTFTGIYQLDGDTLRICLPLRGKDRPTSLESKPGNGNLVFVMKREKQDVKEALIQVGRQELAGTWQAVSYTLDDFTASDEDMKKIQLIIDATGKTSALQDGKPFIASTTAIDPMQKPMTIDVSFTEGNDKGRTTLGIYKLEGDLLTICRAAPGKARPSEFAAKPGSGVTLMSYRREKVGSK